MHSPALSQTGQSRGWLINWNSITEFRASTALALSVLISSPSAIRSEQAMIGLGERLLSTMQMRQLPAIDKPG